MTAQHEETERIRCPACGTLVPVPVGRGSWHAASVGWIIPTEPLACPLCSVAIRVVCMAWLVTVPMRMHQLKSWGIVPCFRRGHRPTHEDLDEVEELFASKAAEQVPR